MPLAIATSNIVAMAFAELEIAHPSSFAEDSDQAHDAALFYAQARDEILEATDWSFASVLVDLPPRIDAGPSDVDLPFTFALPPDCLALRSVGTDSTRWRVDGEILRANETDDLGSVGTLRIRYTTRIENEAKVPPQAKLVIAQRLAMLMLPRWGNTEHENRLGRDYEMSLRMARRSSAREASPDTWSGREHPDIVGSVLR